MGYWMKKWGKLTFTLVILYSHCGQMILILYGLTLPESSRVGGPPVFMSTRLTLIPAYHRNWDFEAKIEFFKIKKFRNFWKKSKFWIFEVILRFVYEVGADRVVVFITIFDLTADSHSIALVAVVAAIFEDLRLVQSRFNLFLIQLELFNLVGLDSIRPIYLLRLCITRQETWYHCPKNNKKKTKREKIDKKTKKPMKIVLFLPLILLSGSSSSVQRGQEPRFWCFSVLKQESQKKSPVGISLML